MTENINLAALIDHTLLKPESTPAMVEVLCEEAKAQAFCSVCILPAFVARAAVLLQDSAVKVCTVAGFPLGANETRVKSLEAAIAVEQGAEEIDMVLNIGLLKTRAWSALEADIAAVVKAAAGQTVKVIFETCLLDEAEKIQACKISVNAGADFVKTSTGFSTAGATLADVQLMRAQVGAGFGVKASGGIRDRQTALAMVAAGANRLGTSSGLMIVGKHADKGGDSY